MSFFLLRIALLSAALMLAMLGALAVGRRYGSAWRAKRPGEEAPGLGTVQGAIFALLGLLIAFTFSGAASRFDSRRELVTAEANAIGTAYLRLDLLPEATQAALRDAFRRYVDLRIELYRSATEPERIRMLLAETIELQGTIWRLAQAAAGQSGDTAARVLLTPSLNEMFDIVTTRTRARFMHPPVVIFVMLGALAMLGAMLAGFELSATADPPRLVPWVFAITLALTFYVILDLEYPRLGFIRLDAADQVMVEVRQSMG
ncbi:MAG: DUF4239 domain-containing protein [Deltaproteobacteria bacterium]|nr:DUF4239 domain-containing protein [Deltaproteobacteria bacterium]